MNKDIERLLELQRFVSDGLSNSKGITQYQEELNQLKSKLNEKLEKWDKREEWTRHPLRKITQQKNKIKELEQQIKQLKEELERLKE